MALFQEAFSKSATDEGAPLGPFPATGGRDEAPKTEPGSEMTERDDGEGIGAVKRAGVEAAAVAAAAVAAAAVAVVEKTVSVTPSTCMTDSIED